MEKFLRLLFAIFLAILNLFVVGVLATLAVWSKGLLIVLVVFWAVVFFIYDRLGRK